MIWGMALPGKFGEFFPDGNFVGWTEELTEYFQKTMPAERRALFDPPQARMYVYYASLNLINEAGLKFPDLPPFGPIAAHEAPKHFVTEKKYTSLGALIMLNNRIWAVNGDLKAIIERLEPSVHHFFPIEIAIPKKAQYFVMAIGQYLDSFSPEKSEAASWRSSDTEGQYFFGEDKKSLSGIALAKQKIGSAHLWRERRMLNQLTCFSDQLMAEIVRAGLRVPKHHKLKEI